MDYEELLRNFGEKLGGGITLEPDTAGSVTLDVDGMPLTILALKELDQVVLSGVIGEPPPENKMEKLYRTMLEANHNFAGTFGATLSINPDDGKVSLVKSLPLAITDGETFFAEVEHFINTLETWCKLVTDFRASEDAPSAAPEEAPMGGFMQV